MPKKRNIISDDGALNVPKSPGLKKKRRAASPGPKKLESQKQVVNLDLTSEK